MKDRGHLSTTPDLIAAYTQTIYSVWLDDETEHCFTVGQNLPWLDELFARDGSESAVFITAENPGSVVLAPAPNRERTLDLKQTLEKSFHRILPGNGASPDGDWQAEESFLAFGVSRSTGVRLAKQYGQNAFVYIGRGHPVELVLFEEVSG